MSAKNYDLPKNQLAMPESESSLDDLLPPALKNESKIPPLELEQSDELESYPAS